MSELFLKLLNMSITAGWLIIAVLFLRLCLKKAPKWINCILWGIVALRLVMPFSFESILSLIPSSEPIPQSIVLSQQPAINSGISVINDAVNPIISQSLTPEFGASVNPIQIIAEVSSVVWVIGVAVMLLYAVISCLRLYNKVKISLHYRENIYFCDNIDSPFILGMIKPKIYIPSGLEERQIEFIIRHEKAHLKRFDHFWKPFGFLLLSVYWFNPVIWVAYILLCRDIELACDERAIKNSDMNFKKGYSETLAECSVKRRTVMACPLAFGEVGVKDRIKSVLNYKKPAFWIIVISIIVITVVAVCFLTNPAEDNATESDESLSEPYSQPEQVSELEQMYPQYFGLDTTYGLKVYVWQMAPNSYSFGLCAGNHNEDLYSELWSLKSVSLETMREIVKTYNLEKSQIEICPIGMLYSSYAYRIDDKYKSNIEKLFWGEIDSIKTVYMIIDRTETEGIPTDTMAEFFFEDDTACYYYPSIKNEYVIVKFYDNTEMTVKDALDGEYIKITDLDLWGINYIKRYKTVE